jgi:NAD(P)-dependent dehydrogenase (short-subunit alcohol dehydrogenase family)
MPSQDKHNADGRAFLVTGASGGMAPFVARALLARGDRLMLTGRNADRLAELEAELDGAGVATLAVDVAEPDDASAAVAQTIGQFGRLDGLIHLAGAFRAGTPVIAADRDLYLDLYRANFLTAAVATQAVLRAMNGGPGWLVYVTSLLAQEPMPTMGPYAASKSALLTWVRALGREVADRGIHANAVVATLVDTPRNRAVQPGADHSHWVPAEAVTDVIAFLSSPAASAFYGSAVPAYGRFALHPPAGAVGGPPPGVPGGPPPGVAGGPPPGMAGGPPPGMAGGPPPGVAGGPPAGAQRPLTAAPR